MQPGGCKFTLHGKDVNIEGALLAFTGDTPALHSVGGFKESVGAAFRLCRECMATHSQIQTNVSMINYV